MYLLPQAHTITIERIGSTGLAIHFILYTLACAGGRVGGKDERFRVEVR